AFRTGVKQVFLLRTRSGYELKLTADHKVLTTNRGDVPAAELQPGVDHVRLATPAFGRNSLNDGFAVGLEIGRCVSQTAGLRAPGTRQGRGVLAAAVTGAGDAGSAACVAVVEVEPEEFALLAETGRRADDFRLRPFAFTVGRSSLTEVLRGLFTAAAEVVRPEGGAPSIVLTSSSPEFVQQVQLLLLPFAIRSRITRDDGQALHALEIHAGFVVRFAEEIGFSEDSPKGDELRQVLEEFDLARDAAGLSDPVEHLVPLGEQPVYDLTEPETRHFVGNGLVVHNCSEYMFIDDTACNLAS